MSLLKREDVVVIKNRIATETRLNSSGYAEVFKVLDSLIKFESNALVAKIEDVADSQDITVHLDIDSNNFTRVSMVAETGVIPVYPRQVKELIAILSKVVERLETQDQS